MKALLFDGRSSKAEEVKLSVSNEILMVERPLSSKSYHVDDIQIEDAFGASPLVLILNSGERIEVPTARTAVDLGLVRNKKIVRFLERGFRGFLVSVALMAFGLTVIALVVVPEFITVIERILPENVFDLVDEGTLRTLDNALFESTNLSEEDREKILQSFKEFLKKAGQEDDVTILFRSTERTFPNALTLAGHTIIVTDDLVKLYKEDNADMVSAILFHELGHHRLGHARKALIQASLFTVFIGLFTGDFSNTALQMTGAIYQLKFSREQEFAADKFALEILTESGADPRNYTTALKKLEEKVRGRAFSHNKEAYEILSWVQTHPSTSERLERAEKIIQGLTK